MHYLASYDFTTLCFLVDRFYVQTLFPQAQQIYGALYLKEGEKTVNITRSSY